MQQEHSAFGKLVVHAKASTARMVRRYILFLIPAIGLGIVGLIGLIDPSVMGMEGEEWVAFIILGAAVLYVLLMLLFVKPYEVAVYEGGLVWKRRGTKINEISFNNFGVSDVIETTTYGFIPISKVRNINITGTNGNSTSLNLTRTNTPNFHNFADTLIAAQHVYITKDWTPENVFNVTLDFGNELILENGKFLHRKGHRKEKFAALQDVVTVDIFDNTTVLRGKQDDFGKSEKLLEVTGMARINTAALYLVVDLALQKQ